MPWFVTCRGTKFWPRLEVIPKSQQPNAEKVGAVFLAWIQNPMQIIIISRCIVEIQKYLNTPQNIAVIILKLVWFYHTVMHRKDGGRMVNSVDLHQATPESTVKTCHRNHFCSPRVSSAYKCLLHTVMILSFRTGRSRQTVQTQIRLLLEEQSDQGLHCLPFHLHLLGTFLYHKTKLFNC